MSHRTVLLQEGIKQLGIGPGCVVVDGTFGAGGHSRLIASIIGRTGTLVAFDRDRSVFKAPVAREIGALTHVVECVADFRNIKHTLALHGISAPDAVLLDLGQSSTEIEHSGRGFTFMKDEPLLMTYEHDPSPEALTAERIIAEWSEDTLVAILSGFADETYAERIARAIVTEREKAPIRTTFDLVRVIESAIAPRFRSRHRHVATRTFQALRMAVNDELGALTQVIDDGLSILKVHGRMVIITFHSVEDRLVKNAFRAMSVEGRGRVLTKRPLVPQEEEVSENPRSRSAKMRVIEKLNF